MKLNIDHTLKPFILLLFLGTTSCASLSGSSYSGNVANGRYSSVDNKLSVAVPNLAEVGIKDNPTQLPGTADARTVIFTAGGYYWMMDGEYIVESLRSPNAPVKKVLAVFPTVMSASLPDFFGYPKNTGLTVKQCKYIQIHSTQAYQCTVNVTVDNTPAMYVGTSFVLNGRVVNAYALEPLQESDVKTPFHWNRYNQMINSIEINN